MIEVDTSSAPAASTTERRIHPRPSGTIFVLAILKLTTNSNLVVLDRKKCSFVLSLLKARFERIDDGARSRRQINLQRSLIGSEYQPIRGRGQPF